MTDATSEAPVRVEGFPLGSLQTNCYLVWIDAGDRPAWIIDAGWAPTELLERAGELSLSVERIVLTHAHSDHISGLADIRKALPGVPVSLHEAEADWLGDPSLNLSASLGDMIPGPEGQRIMLDPPDELLQHDQTLTLGPISWRVLHTPGHSPGSVSLACDSAPIAFVGDALFNGSIGRTDFPTSDHETLIRSIREQLYTLPAETTALAGHGPQTTIGHERLSNPFVRAEAD